MLTFEEYYALNPIAAFSENRWDVYDDTLETLFTGPVFWTPLVPFVDNNAAPDKSYFTGNQMIPGHINANPIGLRQLYGIPLYWDSKGKVLQADARWGQVIRLQEYDKLLNQYRSGGLSKEAFLVGCAQGMLGKSVVETFEIATRNWMLRKALHKFFGPNGQYAGFHEIHRTPSDSFNLAVLAQTKLRLGVRAADSMGTFGTWENPVPGRTGSLSVMGSPAVIHDLTLQRNDFMVMLQQLQDQRLMTGAKIEYLDFVFVEVPWERSVLWNAGNVNTQVMVYKYDAVADGVDSTRDQTGLREDDGAPNPKTTLVDGYLRIGQADPTTCHFVVTSPIDSADPNAIKVGDMVTLHTKRTVYDAATSVLGDNWFGINQGVNWWDGETQRMEVAAIDYGATPGTSLCKIQFRRPVTYGYHYNDGLSIYAASAAVPLAQPNNTPANSTAARPVVAFITKAQHIHPVVVNASRGAHVFSLNKKVTFHQPPAIDDFDFVYRQSWDAFGDYNIWSPDMYEVIYVAGSMGNRGMEVTY